MDILLWLYDYLYTKELEKRKRRPIVEELAFLEQLY
ncbi:MAG: hypothetical protein PWP49_1212 [Thermococcaceae archaeon]|nr:hypothetical protein [Thermococcaceae archaeon]MDK2853984.1 hypothetical protein [Thermococcaceae archaeon]MDK2983483.1 hypothetical protein [Thermococcaceae archaeon]MDN5320792.1 hypothetical protein [Thermococcaceae archaeon]